MHLINLSLDQSLFGLKKLGDSHERFVAYARGFESFTVIVPTKHKIKPYEKTRITYIPAIGKNQLAAFIETSKYLRKTISGKKNTIIICNDPVLGFIALLVKVRFPKVKIQINSFGTRLNQWRWLFEKPYNPFIWIISLISLLFADSIRTDTNGDKEIIQRFTLKEDKKFIVLPVPPTHEVQQKLLSYKQKQGFSKPITFLSVGSLTTNKDFLTLIKSLSIVNKTINFQLTLIGSGPEEKFIKHLVDSLKLSKKVTIKTNLDYNKLLNYYNNSDILISSSRIEGLPRVMQEAALAGLPIIATDTSGAKDFIIHNRTGLKVPIGNSSKLAMAIEKYCDNPQDALENARNSRKFAKKYCDFDRVVVNLQMSWKKINAY